MKHFSTGLGIPHTNSTCGICSKHYQKHEKYSWYNTNTWICQKCLGGWIKAHLELYDMRIETGEVYDDNEWI